MGRDGTGAAAHSAPRFVQNFKTQVDRSVLLIDVFWFSVKKSPGVPSFSFIRFNLCEILKIFNIFVILYYMCIENVLKLVHSLFVAVLKESLCVVDLFVFCVENWSTWLSFSFARFDLCEISKIHTFGSKCYHVASEIE